MEARGFVRARPRPSLDAHLALQPYSCACKPRGSSGHGFSRAVKGPSEEAALAAEAMSIPKRHAHSPGTYFVTSRTWGSRALFIKPPICEIFLETLFKYRQQGAYRLHAFVLMPDHFHALLTPSEETTLERSLQYIKGASAHRIGSELNFRFPVWQRGFSDHRIRDLGDYKTHLRYIEQNPVKRRLVNTVGEYPWSSISGRFSLDAPPQGLKPSGRPPMVRHG